MIVFFKLIDRQTLLHPCSEKQTSYPYRYSLLLPFFHKSKRSRISIRTM